MLLLACGINPDSKMTDKLHQYLEKDRGVDKIDFVALALTLSHLKGLEAANEGGNEGDEYLDAFVFLGGSPDKEGSVSKELLIEVIKEEFGLTIDMVVSFLFLEANNAKTRLILQNEQISFYFIPKYHFNGDGFDLISQIKSE